MHEHDEIDYRPRARGRAVRWLARCLFVVLGLMMGLVVASDPRVTGAARAALAQMQGTDEVVTRQDTTLSFPALPDIVERVWPGAATADATADAPADAPASGETPRVSILPESRVNVIRLTP